MEDPALSAEDRAPGRRQRRSPRDRGPGGGLSEGSS
jgi:hypothetical protein